MVSHWDPPLPTLSCVWTCEFLPFKLPRLLWSQTLMFHIRVLSSGSPNSFLSSLSQGHLSAPRSKRNLEQPPVHLAEARPRLRANWNVLASHTAGFRDLNNALRHPLLLCWFHPQIGSSHTEAKWLPVAVNTQLISFKPSRKGVTSVSEKFHGSPTINITGFGVLVSLYHPWVTQTTT